MRKNIRNLFNRNTINEQFNIGKIDLTNNKKPARPNIFNANPELPADVYYKQILETGDVSDEAVEYLRDKVALVKVKSKEDLERIINIYSMQYKLQCEPLNWLDVSEITNMFGLFRNKRYNGNISRWNVQNVKYMQFMFYKSQFNQDISEWDVQNVENMSYMFMYSKFDKNISEWNVSHVKDKIDVFSDSQVIPAYRPKFR